MAGQSKCVSSQYNIQIKAGSSAHQYDVEIVYTAGGRRPRTFTRGGDAFQKDRCRHILRNFDRLEGNVYAYDGQACLWTSKKLEGDGVRAARFEMDQYLRNSLGGDGSVSVTLKFVRSIDLSDFSNYIHHVNNAVEDRTLRNVLEMILSQHALERPNNRYSGISPGLLCESAEAPFHRGLCVRTGNTKGVHIVKSSHGPQPLLAISNTKKVFYPSDANFLEVLRTSMGPRNPNYSEAERLFRGVKLQLRYNPGRTFTFRGFTGRPLRDETFMDEQQEVTIQEYLLRKYNVTIEYPQFYGATIMQGNAVFPLEQFTIIPDQIVPDTRVPLREDALKMNRLNPSQRYDAIADQFARLEMNNPVTKGFGIKIEENMVRGVFTRSDKVGIVARNNSHLFTNDFGVFKFDKNLYLKAARVNGLIVLSPNKRLSMECVRATVEECRRKGTILPEPEYIEFDTQNQNMDDWVTVLEQYRGQRTLVFVVNSGTDTHALIKLAESMTCVPTQHLLLKTAENVGRQPQTRENVSHKVNLKTGGLNHQVMFTCVKLDLNRNNVLVIGLDVCHPTGDQRRGETAEPSFTGITGNYLEHPCAFAGTFFAQESRKESVDPVQLKALTLQMLKKVAKHRKIDTVVLMRDGVSEGQYNMALSIELNAIEEACTDYFKHSKTQLLGIIVTKSGNVRHFNVSNNRPESLLCRSIVSFGTRENYTQFYMVPHKAPQGLAKAVMCTTIRNDLHLPETEIHSFVMALTSLHQIVNQPISLPEPIYQADKLAARGQLNFRTFQRFFPDQIPHENPHNEGSPINFRLLTTRISFNVGSLPSIRFTA